MSCYFPLARNSNCGHRAGDRDSLHLELACPQQASGGNWVSKDQEVFQHKIIKDEPDLN